MQARPDESRVARRVRGERRDVMQAWFFLFLPSSDWWNPDVQSVRPGIPVRGLRRNPENPERPYGPTQSERKHPGHPGPHPTHAPKEAWDIMGTWQRWPDIPLLAGI